MNEIEFQEKLQEINVILNNKQLETLKNYALYLLEYNNHTNLTAIKDIKSVYLKHFYDSLTVMKYLAFKENDEVLDIGTGAGFPGLVLKIAYPQIKLTLLDSNNKKTEFLKKCCEKLDIKDVVIKNERAENFIKNNREKFDYIFSRAVASLRILSELSIPGLKINGTFYALKSHSEEELKEATNTILKLNSQIENIWEFSLPENAGYRSIIAIKKISSTPTLYPRTYDKIKKKAIA